MSESRQQLHHDLEIQVLIHNHLSADEIIERPSVKELLEVLYPKEKAQKIVWKFAVTKILRQQIGDDGNREYVAAVQETLPDMDLSPEPIVTEKYIYVPAEEATSQQMIDGMNRRRKLILGTIRQDPFLPEHIKVGLYGYIDSAYDSAVKEVSA